MFFLPIVRPDFDHEEIVNNLQQSYIDSFGVDILDEQIPMELDPVITQTQVASASSKVFSSPKDRVGWTVHGKDYDYRKFLGLINRDLKMPNPEEVGGYLSDLPIIQQIQRTRDLVAYMEELGTKDVCISGSASSPLIQDLFLDLSEKFENLFNQKDVAEKQAFFESIVLEGEKVQTSKSSMRRLLFARILHFAALVFYDHDQTDQLSSDLSNQLCLLHR